MSDITPDNPYERRGARWSTGDMSAVQPVSLSSEVRLRNGLAIEDLQAMAASAHKRGEMAMVDRLEAPHAEDLRTARRYAWEEGREAGRQDLITDLGARYGERARRVHQRGRDVLEVVAGDKASVSKRDLEVALDSAVDMLAELIHGHHEGFAAKPVHGVPF